MARTTNIRLFQKLALCGAWVAGILYCSWPLGPMLNRPGRQDWVSERARVAWPALLLGVCYTGRY